jgi:hypothetical protein
MDRCQYEATMIETEVGTRKDLNSNVISIIHHNVQSLNNKLLNLAVLLQSDLKDIDVLCFTEHWQKEKQIKLSNIDQFKLLSNFNRNNTAHGGSCIYVRKYLQTKEVNYFKGINKGKDFEMYLNYWIIKSFLCVYRSPGHDFYIFLRNLELVTQKVQSKIFLFCCGSPCLITRRLHCLCPRGEL